MIRTCRHLNGNSRRTRRLLCYRHSSSGHRSGRNGGIAGRNRDSAISCSIHREGGRRGIVVNRCSVLAQAQRARRLPYLPHHILRSGSTVRPLIVGLRRKGRRVGTGIRTGRRTGHGHFGGIIVVPGRRLRAACIRQRPLLRRHRQASDAGDLAGFVGRRQMVRTFSHRNCNSRHTRRLLGHRHGRTVDRYRSNIGIAGRHGNRSISSPCHRERGG